MTNTDYRRRPDIRSSRGPERRVNESEPGIVKKFFSLLPRIANIFYTTLTIVVLFLLISGSSFQIITPAGSIITINSYGLHYDMDADGNPEITLSHGKIAVDYNDDGEADFEFDNGSVSIDKDSVIKSIEDVVGVL